MNEGKEMYQSMFWGQKACKWGQWSQQHGLIQSLWSNSSYLWWWILRPPKHTQQAMPHKRSSHSLAISSAFQTKDSPLNCPSLLPFPNSKNFTNHFTCFVHTQIGLRNFIDGGERENRTGKESDEERFWRDTR